MKILSHRGYWKHTEEKNSLVAFERSFKLGFGTETDVRDSQGVLVISHDPPRGDELPLAVLLELANQNSNPDSPLSIALNIKSDGLAGDIAKLLPCYKNIECFVFDMSVPDMRSYFFHKQCVFTRISELERQPACLEIADGVWFDGFENDWFGVEEISDILQMGKKVCIVSPELHKRSHLALWKKLRECQKTNELMLCTDMPEDAFAFFERA